MGKLYDFLTQISKYRDIIRTCAILLGCSVLFILIFNAVRHLMEGMKAKEEEAKEDNLKNLDYDRLEKRGKSSTLKTIVAPDALDPAPNSYCIVNDGGKDIYVRNLTITKMPKRDKFAVTFSELFDFPNCTSSVFVRPVMEESIIHQMDHQITVLNSEYVGAKGDPNRQRKLQYQINDVSKYAEQVENGENKFFSVAFLFTLFSDNIRDLNRQTSLFRTKAVSKGLEVSSCFGEQAEAFAYNAPMNREGNINSGFIKFDTMKWLPMDKKSLSAVYNYTQTSFSHMNGCPLGRDMFTGDPVIFDQFDQSHDGYTMIIAGMTGSGKSATIKQIGCRTVPHGTRYVCIDSQVRKGTSEGEYAALAVLCDGVNFQISNASNEIMNIFDVGETVKTVKAEDGTINEVRTLDLADKIIMVTHILKHMIIGTGEAQEIPVQLATYVNRLLTDNVTQMYKNFGIIDGDPDSLYTTPGSPLAADKGMTSGRPVKLLPTLTDFYKQVLLSNRDNRDHTLKDAYNIILKSLVDFVRELYYSEQSCFFFTREQYQKLQFSSEGVGKYFLNDQGDQEAVVELHGIRAYFDGQSTFHISKDCPFTNIDISQLQDAEKGLARQVAMDFVNENFVKKNSTSLKSSEKMVVIIDEAHESFKQQYVLATIDGVVRTARKMHVGVILSSQTLSEYSVHPETMAILKQATAKLVFKQDYQDKKFLIETVGLTEPQADFIVNRLGGNVADESEKNKHRGEVCIIDNKQVCFCKVDYRKSTEALAVETDAREIEDLFKLSA